MQKKPGCRFRHYYVSLRFNGAVAAISVDYGRILDVHVMSKFCQLCNAAEKIKTQEPDKYLQLIDHTCTKNHDGSAPADVEDHGVKTIFQRSIEKNKLRYLEFYGDGDSKGHASVENIYPGAKVIKQECIGHVQKRVGKYLKTLKKNVNGLGGEGRLTNVLIERLQNYCGIAIRSNVGELEKMKRAVAAVLCHVAAPKGEDFFHDHCPDGGDSWCRFKADKANSTKIYIGGAGISKDVYARIKPKFEELADEGLLKKCLHGKTQNQSENFNNIWERVPKTTFIGLTVFEFGVNDAVSHFNIGNMATIQTYNHMRIIPGHYTTIGCIGNNTVRMKNAFRKSSEKYRKRRKGIRGAKKGQSRQKKQKERNLYEYGGF